VIVRKECDDDHESWRAIEMRIERAKTSVVIEHAYAQHVGTQKIIAIAFLAHSSVFAFQKKIDRFAISTLRLLKNWAAAGCNGFRASQLIKKDPTRCKGQLNGGPIASKDGCFGSPLSYSPTPEIAAVALTVRRQSKFQFPAVRLITTQPKFVTGALSDH
jgi:hypothetical protein